MNISEWQQQAVADLAKLDTNPQLEARLLVGHVLKMETDKLILHTEDKLTDEQIELLSKFVDQRVRSHIPMAYILGTKGFMDFEVKVNESVLIPRPETEAIVEKAIEIINNKNINTVFELGTGSGVIAIAIAKNCPGVEVVASDISKDALELAHDNVKDFGLENQIELIHSDMGSHFDSADLIVANLPYLPTNLEIAEELKSEPQIALWSGLDGLDHYRELLELNFDTAIIELGENQYQPFADYIKGQNLNYKTTPVLGVDGQIVGMVITKE
ncbi:MAG: peptide chain release factor N(5)-glutamine methyltransferase [Patescibacteria group bacterium]